MELTLAGRTALITGASSGFGAHFARLFVREGANVVIGARRVEKVAALAAELGDACARRGAGCDGRSLADRGL